MKTTTLFAMGAVAALASGLSLVVASRASTVVPSRATTPAARTVQFESLLSQLDPDLSTMAAQLQGRASKGRSGVPERQVTWTTEDGTTITARIWLTEVNGKPTQHTSVEARRDLAETANQSFNLQYLNLQQQLQDENRRFTLISNIMKTKHDTSENSIGNVR
jgi:hypothetical protein